MIAHDSEPAVGVQPANRGVEACAEHVHLAVDFDAQRLERAPRRVSATSTGRCRNGLLHHVNELVGPFDGCLGPRPHDELRDARSPALLSVSVEDPGEVVLCVCVDDLCCG